MYQTKTLDTDHKDVVHDIAFDYYGRRMATCSSDQVVKIWNLQEGSWVLNGTLKSHSGAVWKVTWAHPEFGQIIATCSFDRSASVYEETVSETGHGMQTSWVKRCNLVDARSSVTDVKFAPKCMGLVLATCSADGLVRIYEAFDVMNLSQWASTHNINTRLPSCSCLTWNPSPSKFCPPLLAVGSDDGCLGGGSAISSGGTASTSSNLARVAVFAYNDTGRRWDQVESMVSITDPVHDIAFAPNPGRSFHTLAIASNDLRIIVMKPKPVPADSSSEMCHGFDLQLAGQFPDQGSNVWRVSWNVTGTVLSASGDNGMVMLYKANYLDVWKCVGTLSSSSALPTPGDSANTGGGNDSSVNVFGGGSSSIFTSNNSGGNFSSGGGGGYGANTGGYGAVSTTMSFAAAASKGLNVSSGANSNNSSAGPLNTSNSNAKYFQMAPTHPSQIPWH